MRFAGFYEDHELPVKRGQLVTIKKGTMVKTVGRDAKPAGRTYKVKINHILNGTTERIDGEYKPTSNPKIVWAGPGGYWSEADINDIPEAMAALPSIAEAVRRLGWKAEEWEGNCYAVACQFVEAGLVEGTAVYGHWLGPIAEGSMFEVKRDFGFCQHGWVLLKDGRILDPTRWAFEGKEPYIHIGSFNPKEYDEGGNGLRAALRPLHPPPAYNPKEKQFEFSATLLPSAAWTFLEKLLDIDYTKQKPGVLDMMQVFWVANLPYEDLQPHTATIFNAIVKVGLSAAIPQDNRKRAQREVG